MCDAGGRCGRCRSLRCTLQATAHATHASKTAASMPVEEAGSRTTRGAHRAGSCAWPGCWHSSSLLVSKPTMRHRAVPSWWHACAQRRHRYTIPWQSRAAVHRAVVPGCQPCGMDAGCWWTPGKTPHGMRSTIRRSRWCKRGSLCRCPTARCMCGTAWWWWRVCRPVSCCRRWQAVQSWLQWYGNVCPGSMCSCVLSRWWL